MSVSEISKEEGINKATLYYWRQQLRKSGTTVPNMNTPSEQWSAQTKLSVIAETYSMTENELSQYCREKGTIIKPKTIGLPKQDLEFISIAITKNKPGFTEWVHFQRFGDNE